MEEWRDIEGYECVICVHKKDLYPLFENNNG